MSHLTFDVLSEKVEYIWGEMLFRVFRYSASVVSERCLSENCLMLSAPATFVWHLAVRGPVRVSLAAV